MGVKITRHVETGTGGYSEFKIIKQRKRDKKTYRKGLIMERKNREEIKAGIRKLLE